MIVKLEPFEAYLAAMAGVSRNIQQTTREAVDTYGDPHRGDFQVHIIGAMGEMAVAKALGVWWPGKGKFRGADVGDDLQVRTSEGGRSLILHESDADELLFYFVRKVPRRFEFLIHEPIRGRDGKRAEYWRNDEKVRPAFFVPVVSLIAR